MSIRVERHGQTYDIWHAGKKAAVRGSSSKRALLFLCMGWMLTSCICSFNLAYLDEFPHKQPDAESPLDAVTLTRESLETVPGEPYLVATFPGGAEVFLLSPQEDAVLTDPWVDVAGSAPVETVITLNEEIAVAGADGMFYARVPLEEGLNEIQCVASDLEGNKVAFSFLVVYEPE
jgi:hypothetical protein